MPKRQVAQEESDRIVLNFEDHSRVLTDLSFVEILTKDYKTAATKKIEWAIREKDAKSSLFTIVEEVRADAIVYGDWSVANVRPKPGKKVNMDKLATNLALIGKLDAATIAKIFTASMDPLPAKVPHVRITAPDGLIPKMPKGGDE